MPRNASTGVYTLPSNSVSPAVAFTTLSSSAFNALASDISSGLNGIPHVTTTGLDSGLVIDQTLTGSASLGYWNSINIGSDDVPVDFSADFYIEHHYGGATKRGARAGVFGWMVQDSANSGTGSTHAVGIEGIGQSNVGDGGTNTTEAGSKGGYYGANLIGRNAGTNVHLVTALECDTMSTGSATTRYQFGIANANFCAAQADVLDAAMCIYSGGEIAAAGGSGPWGPGIGFKYGIVFGELSGNGLVPISSDGTLFCGYVESLSTIDAANGIDLTNFTFSGSAFKSNLFSVSQTGLVFSQGLWVNGDQVVTSRNTGWSAMTGSADKATVYDTSTVTLPQLAGRVMALQAALTTHGLIGA